VTDSKLRELERRWKETGSVEDEWAWLSARVRGGERLDWESYSRLAELDVGAATEYLRERVDEGDLSQERLELAALCSHDPACVLLRLSDCDDQDDLEGWCLRLTRRSRRLLIEALVEVVRACHRRLRDPIPVAESLIEEVSAWTRDDRLAHLDCALTLAESAASWAERSEGPPCGVAWAAHHLAHAAQAAADQPESLDEHGRGTLTGLEGAERMEFYTRLVVYSATKVVPSESLRRGATESLLERILG